MMNMTTGTIINTLSATTSLEFWWPNQVQLELQNCNIVDVIHYSHDINYLEGTTAYIHTTVMLLESIVMH